MMTEENNPSQKGNDSKKRHKKGANDNNDDDADQEDSLLDSISQESSSMLGEKGKKMTGVSMQAQKFLKNEKLRKIVSKGGFFKLSEDKKQFVRSSQPTQDYFTLIRHATWIRLMK